MDNQPARQKDINQLYPDIAACFVALASALEKKGVLTNEELRVAAQERLLTLIGDGQPESTYRILKLMALDLPTLPDGR